MAYKLISEWRSPNGIEHEIVVFKYNISHDEKVRYYKTADSFVKEEFFCNGEPNRTTYLGGN